MNKFKIIFVNWTKPYFNKHKQKGIKSYLAADSPSTEYKLEDYEKAMQLLSITSAKRYGKCPVKLYTDDAGYECYKKEGLIDYFDEVDVEFLNGVNSNPDINASQFWTSGKILSICNEEPPFLFLDTDFFLQSEIPKWVFEKDVVHAHWEVPRAWLYVPKGRLNDEFGLDFPEFNEYMLIPNTCFLFMNNKEIQQRYKELHLQIVTKGYNHVNDELWLMTDQNILGYILRDKKANVGHAKNKVFMQFGEQETMTDDTLGTMPVWTKLDGMKQFEPEVKYDHVWFQKIGIHSNPEYRKTVIHNWTLAAEENIKALKSTL